MEILSRLELVESHGGGFILVFRYFIKLFLQRNWYRFVFELVGADGGRSNLYIIQLNCVLNILLFN